MRGDPGLGVHWNIREDFYHHLGIIDDLMMRQYGEDGIPRRGDGRLFRLAETFYSPKSEAGDIFADELISGLASSLGDEIHISGTIYHAEFIDDRYRNGKPNRSITVLDRPNPPMEPDLTRVGRPTIDVLDGPSMFQAGAIEVLTFLRRYLQAIEKMDMAAGRVPRVRLYTSHRVVSSVGDTNDGFLRWFQHEDGFVRHPDGRLQVLIEEIEEFDLDTRFRRVRRPGTPLIDLGVPKLFVLAQGYDSSDADRLGFQQHDVEIDHHDGRGPVVAQADYLAGFLELHIGGRLRRRIASEFDRKGNEYWVRQIAVGHENDPEVGWLLVQVPDFKTFDPVLAGLVPENTPRKSAEYVAAYKHMLRDFYLDQAALILELPREDLETVQMPYGPKMFSLVERMGTDARVAANGVVAGDTFGNGHFLTSGGAITGMVGHACRVYFYWKDIDAGKPENDAVRTLADAIEEDTLGWLHVSAQEFSQALPINFGQERIAQIEAKSGVDSGARATTIDATRRHRKSLLPLDPSDWRRLTIRAGRLHVPEIPALQETHPDERAGSVVGAASDMGGGDGMPGTKMARNA
ncbi:hypothetical protein [Microtetraspora sp. NBRC 13810]|uniref:hypothetical protein n=1 Tax=Microtetraspora sp. NBRC 13810 TaxID=3030990 RepID=UPI00255318D8|nr:hypothetical protein [Microtetraspora sp. NBRC 13810]